MERRHSEILGPLALVTAPASPAVSQAEALTHLKMDHLDATADSAEIDLINALVTAATNFCQHQVSGHRQFMLATYDVKLAAWWGGPLELPRPPLSSVSYLKYYDRDGTLQTVAASTYLVETPWRDPGTIELAPDEAWPTDLQPNRRLPIVLRFIAGYASAAAVPEEIKAAVRLALTWLYEDRGPSDRELTAVHALLDTTGYGSYL